MAFGDDISQSEIDRILGIPDDPNPKDRGGPGYDDEEGEAPGEQAGNELDVEAQNRPRTLDGEFI